MGLHYLGGGGGDGGGGNSSSSSSSSAGGRTSMNDRWPISSSNSISK